jgi:hypothetical protein
MKTRHAESYRGAMPETQYKFGAVPRERWRRRPISRLDRTLNGNISAGPSQLSGDWLVRALRMAVLCAGVELVAHFIRLQR